MAELVCAQIVSVIRDRDTGKQHESGIREEACGMMSSGELSVKQFGKLH